MAKIFNRAKMTTATTGSGTITLGSASTGFQSFADAGVSDGDVVQYVIEEGSDFEIGTGTYTASGTTLTRTPSESSNSDAAITLAGGAKVSIVAIADDFNRLQHGGSDKVTVSSGGASVTGNLDVSSGLDVTGSITVTGTVDGRDIATDGTKLDGISSGAEVNDPAFKTISVSGQSDVVADADADTLIFAAGSNVTITTDASTDTVTFAATVPTEIPSGTAMLFQQTSAPTGFTKVTTHDNKALRIVSGTASSGGSVGFTTAFASQSVSGSVGSTTLSTSHMPSHRHKASNYHSIVGWSGNSPGRVLANSLNYSSNGAQYTDYQGGGSSHNHSFSGTAINLAVNYVDVIIATKD